MALFENYERRIGQIDETLKKYGIASIEEAKQICDAKGIDPYKIAKETQPICFENAGWAYVVGAAIAIKKGCTKAAEAAEAIGEGLQAFCLPGSVADDRKVGLGHGNLAAMLLRENTKCFAFLAGHESFAAAEGAIGIAKSANKVRKEPLKVILNGLGKDAAQIISRINGFTYVKTRFDYLSGKLEIVEERPYSKGDRGAVRCYGSDDVREGVSIMHYEGVDVSITGNSTNPTRFQHPVAGTYKKECIETGQEIFFGRIGRWNRKNTASRQHGRRACVLWNDRHDGADAFGRPVCRFVVSPRTRGNDGVPRYGQQPYGRRYRGGGCRPGAGIALKDTSWPENAFQGYAASAKSFSGLILQ